VNKQNLILLDEPKQESLEWPDATTYEIKESQSHGKFQERKFFAKFYQKNAMN